jgi:hypothetical protein
MNRICSDIQLALVTFVIDDWFSKVTSISRTQFVTWIFKKIVEKCL